MLSYYVQVKHRHDPRSKHQVQRGKASAVSVNRSGSLRGWWCYETLSRDFRGQSPLRELLGSKKHLDWLKINLNKAKIITAQDYKHAQN